MQTQGSDLIVPLALWHSRDPHCQYVMLSIAAHNIYMFRTQLQSGQHLHVEHVSKREHATGMLSSNATVLTSCFQHSMMLLTQYNHRKTIAIRGFEQDS